jgi:hypothetical protein
LLDAVRWAASWPGTPPIVVLAPNFDDIPFAVDLVLGGAVGLLASGRPLADHRDGTDLL